MKVIEALKKLSYLEKKASDIKDKIYQHSADLSYETPVYGSEDKQREQKEEEYEEVMRSSLQAAMKSLSIKPQEES